MEAAFKLEPLHSELDRRLTPAERAVRLRRVETILPELRHRLSPCTLCPRHCGALRDRGETGECGLSQQLRVASVARHTGEEPLISGKIGAINVFFSGCNLHCLHCQNWPISQRHVGRDLTVADLADRIIKKWRRGAHTLGWVTPTPQLPQALAAYHLCLQEGLNLPLVHNGGGYEDPEIIHLLTGIIDLWLPDSKTADTHRGLWINQVPNYPQINLMALSAMVNQVRAGAARAVIARHLILPEGAPDSKRVLQRLWESFGNEVYLSLMSQYFPTSQTLRHKTLGRPITQSEYTSLIQYARRLGFQNGWVQHLEEAYGIPLHCLS